ncbi:MAG: slipin family protein [Candidatus Vogelbacteria bacterium]|nr:slipin family protein [Candidatus Vogelbacteria bacterium]
MNRSSHPVSTLVSVLIYTGIIAYVLYVSGIVSGVSLAIGVIVIFALVLLFSGLRIIDQFEKGIVLTLGKYTGTKEPGLNWIMPVVQTIQLVDMRVTTVDIPQQEVITKDNVPVGINAVVYFQVEQADVAVLKIQNYSLAVSQYAQAALRDVIGGVELDSLLSERDKLSKDIKDTVDLATKAWGVDVSDIKIQDIELPADMKRIMAKQAESERERRATIIRSEGEFAAADKLAQAAERLSQVPGGLAMRTLATIEKINPDPSKTVIFALPVEFMEGVKAMGDYMKDKVK